MNAIRVCWQWDQASQRNAVAGTREGHGNALGHGDRQTTRVPGSFFVQDATRLCECVTQMCKDFGFGQPKRSNTLSFEKIAERDGAYQLRID